MGSHSVLSAFEVFAFSDKLRLTKNYAKVRTTKRFRSYISLESGLIFACQGSSSPSMLNGE